MTVEQERKAYERHADRCREEGFEPCSFFEWICDYREYQQEVA